MNRNEVRILNAETQIEFANGQVAKVKTVDQSNETITLQFEEVSLRDSSSVGNFGVMGGYSLPKIFSSDGAIDPNPPIPPPPVVQAQQSTTVICKWIELANANMV
jgi:hypothetical protein